jgi:hypothetical protein
LRRLALRLWYSAASRSVRLDVTTVGRLLCTWVHPVVDQLIELLARPSRVRLRAEVVQGQRSVIDADQVVGLSGSAKHSETASVRRPVNPVD